MKQNRLQEVNKGITEEFFKSNRTGNRGRAGNNGSIFGRGSGNIFNANIEDAFNSSFNSSGINSLLGNLNVSPGEFNLFKSLTKNLKSSF
jgi:hypothetical protein